MQHHDEGVVESIVFPPTFETSVYRSVWPDLAGFSDEALRAHFHEWGQKEGRRCNRLEDRNSFVALIPETADTLEIGPFCNPLLKGPNAQFFDVLDRAGLESRARSIGIIDPVAPLVTFVSPTGDLAVVDKQFDYVLSSHCVEHQPYLIHHLQQVGRILRPGGRYFLLVPDKRYCFDSLLAESNIAQVLEAHQERRKVHTFRSVIEHRALTTHNESGRHWAGDHGGAEKTAASRVTQAINEFEASAGTYVDVHAWCFTPAGMEGIIEFFHDNGTVDLQLERMYPTRAPNNEFWMILLKN